MRPFLLLATRSEDLAADDEYAAFLRYGGLDEPDLRRARLEQVPLGHVRLDDYSGVIVGGSPFNSSDREKSPVQCRVEAELGALLDEIVARDFPFLGACYGIGTLGIRQGGIVDGLFAEPVGAVSVSLTEAGRADPLFRALPDVFDAYVGHKEAISHLPTSAVLLASSSTCPVQAFRVGTNVYATQFHPELDLDGIRTRIEVYKHAGYFEPQSVQSLLERLCHSTVQHPAALVRTFVETYAC